MLVSATRNRALVVADVGYLYFFATSAQGVRSTLFFSAPDSPAIIPNPLSALHLLILVLHNLLFMTGQKWTLSRSL
jgi:hypothetical protein